MARTVVKTDFGTVTVTGAMRKTWISTIRRDFGASKVMEIEGAALGDALTRKFDALYPGLQNPDGSKVYHFGGKTLKGRWGSTHIVFPRSWQAKEREARPVVRAVLRTQGAKVNFRSRKGGAL